MIRSSAQPSTKACASSALANETCAICACLRSRILTCGAATTTTLVRRRGDSQPRQRGGQAYLHTAVAPDDSLDAPFGRTRREGDLDPAGPHALALAALPKDLDPRRTRSHLASQVKSTLIQKASDGCLLFMYSVDLT